MAEQEAVARRERGPRAALAVEPLVRVRTPLENERKPATPQAMTSRTSASSAISTACFHEIRRSQAKPPLDGRAEAAGLRGCGRAGFDGTAGTLPLTRPPL